jgi:D-3-phosphoglycerate dehydrogenase
LPCFAKLDGLDVAVFNDHVDDPAARADQLATFDAVILIRERSRITRRFLEDLPSLKLISQFGKYPHIDIDACSDHGVLVCSGKRSHAPSHAAAEHSWALIMSAMKNIPGQMQNLQNGKWQKGVGKGLFGRRLGLYGYGRIAKRVAEYAEAFGMQVEWWGSADGRARAQADGRRIAKDRAGFFAENDIVSLHVRLTPETRGIITAADLAQMKQDALLVNTSRSALLGSDVLLQALDAGRPGAAAIDVFDQEPISWRDDKLACHWRVIATPHIGFVTEEELEMQFSEVFDQVVAWHNGAPINMVNPAVWQPVSDDA